MVKQFWSAPEHPTATLGVVPFTVSPPTWTQNESEHFELKFGDVVVFNSRVGVTIDNSPPQYFSIICPTIQANYLIIDGGNRVEVVFPSQAGTYAIDYEAGLIYMRYSDGSTYLKRAYVDEVVERLDYSDGSSHILVSDKHGNVQDRVTKPLRATSVKDDI